MSALLAFRVVRRRRSRHAAVVLISLGIIVVLLALSSLGIGRPSITPENLLRSLLGAGNPAERFIVLDLRLPRVASGLLIGAAFGLSGAVFQSVLRNPLASPDVVGVTQGASAAAVVAVLSLGLVGSPVSLAALGGGALVAVLCLLLAGRTGAAGSRFVLVGIASAFLLNALIGYLLTRADIRGASEALGWLVGSLSSLPWDQLASAAVAVALPLGVLRVLEPRLRVIQLGTELASGLGARPGRDRALLLLVAVALVAVATALAGPIAFVALAAPPIARALTRDGGAALSASALVGVSVVLGADLVAQNSLPDTQLPTGVVTGILGAPVLLVLLGRRARAEQAAP